MTDDSIENRIRNFTESICNEDINRERAISNQTQQWNIDSTMMRNPLPVDFATSQIDNVQQPKFVDQLIYSPNTDVVKVLLDPLRNSWQSSTQSKTSIFAAAASSGVGKTFLAYSVGLLEPTIVIRIGTGMNQYSAPWTTLIHHLEQYEYHNDINAANKAYRCLKILLWCYISVSSIVLNIAENQLSCKERAKEVLLRFHRNGISESIINCLFTKNMNCAETDDQYNVFISSISSTGRWLLCLDEVQVLLDIFPNLFYQEETFTALKRGITPSDCQRHGLFYGLTCCLNSLARSNKDIRSYLTGTHFSIAQLDKIGVFLSIERSNLQKIELLSGNFLTTAAMINILIYYWNFSENDLRTKEILDLLKQFEGRPLYFVDYVFKKIRFQEFVQRGCDRSQFVLKFSKYLKQAISDLRMFIKGCLNEFFDNNKPLHPTLYCTQTVASLYPGIIKHVLCGDESILMNEDEIAIAIATRLIPSSTTEEVNLKETEPMTFECIRDWLLVRLKNKNTFSDIYKMFIGSLRNSSKSLVVEEALCYYFALRVAATENGTLTLEDLLQPLFPDEYKPAEKLMRIQISCFKVVNKVDMSCFVDSNDNYRTDIIVWGFDPEMGVDIAFLGKCNNGICPVVIQCKSGNWSGLRGSVLTVSPGLQYLNNSQRTAILCDSIQSLSGKQLPLLQKQKSSKRKSFEDFMSKYPQLATNWIRVSVTVSTPDMTQFNDALDDEINIPSELLGVYEESPLVPLTFHSDTFLIAVLMEYFELKGDHPSHMPQHTRAYYPVSIQLANNALLRFTNEKRGETVLQQNVVIPTSARWRLCLITVVVSAFGYFFVKYVSSKKF